MSATASSQSTSLSLLINNFRVDLSRYLAAAAWLQAWTSISCNQTGDRVLQQLHRQLYHREKDFTNSITLICLRWWIYYRKESWIPTNPQRTETTLGEDFVDNSSSNSYVLGGNKDAWNNCSWFHVHVRQSLREKTSKRQRPIEVAERCLATAPQSTDQHNHLMSGLHW